ncbi:MAG TPA: hypothetical protein PLX23_00645 [Candidatus Hydrogenedens sp.]|nr:hypothetical protein [Candidatus Hydrogenedens sp.]
MRKYLSYVFLLLLIYTSIANAELSTAQKQEIEKAQHKILNYIRLNKSHFRVEDLFLLDYLQRRFHLSDEFSFQKSFNHFPTPQDKNSLEVYGRLVNYKSVRWKKPAKAESFIWLELKALFVEKQEDCPDKKELLMQLSKQSNERSYACTHSALALGWFMEQGCLSREDKEVQQLQNLVIQRLLSESNIIQFPSDIKIEALAFICYLGGKEKINPKEILDILHYQREDGAFSGTISPTDGINVHTTLLVFWLTFEFLNEHTSYNEPMICPKEY